MGKIEKELEGGKKGSLVRERYNRQVEGYRRVVRAI